MVRPILPCWAAFLQLPGCTRQAPVCFLLSFLQCPQIPIPCAWLCLVVIIIHNLPADFLYSPMTSTEQKRKMVENLAKEARLKKRTVNFVNLLIDKHRVDAVEDVFAAFEEEYCTLTDTQVGWGWARP